MITYAGDHSTPTHSQCEELNATTLMIQITACTQFVQLQTVNSSDTTSLNHIKFTLPFDATSFRLSNMRSPTTSLSRSKRFLLL